MKILKTFAVIGGTVLVLLGIGYVYLYFAMSDVTFIDRMKGTYDPIPEREEETREQAQEYLNTVFTGGHYTIYDIAFESNDTDTLYSYAGMVRDEVNNVEFLVFHNNQTGKMEDNYVAMKWTKDLGNDLRPFITEQFGEAADLYVYFDERQINAYNIDPNQPGSYKDYKFKPQIYVPIERKKKAEDEKAYPKLLIFVKKECGLKHAFVNVQYYVNQEPMMEDDWVEEF
ncbi:hypothetical protein [Bacillus benzoevorans]|uniref:Uncharacterized protein n=1 Tax=Bacillus benzoevorans TaxID=1456 RepID=A0A7X0HWP5_9BACI|nr:hypothetical protein [Bacillus benzoevorans]MBB6447005.1 hypothetical protein [Bacillus benzoevorans]